MRRLIAYIFFIFIGLSLVVLSRKLKFEMLPKARAQGSATASAPAASKTLPAPTDMPLPTDAAPTSPALPPPPPVPQQGLPTGAKAAPANPSDLPPTGLPSPQELDPNLKFLSTQEFVYDPTGRRDPFKSYLYVAVKTGNGKSINTSLRGGIPTLLQGLTQKSEDTAESFDLTELKVAAILWDVNDPKAMLQGPNRSMYMVHRHTRVGKNGGYVATIREGEVVVVEFAPDGKTPSTRVMVLQK